MICIKDMKKVRCQGAEQLNKNIFFYDKRGKHISAKGAFFEKQIYKHSLFLWKSWSDEANKENGIFKLFSGIV